MECKGCCSRLPLRVTHFTGDALSTLGRGRPSGRVVDVGSDPGIRVKEKIDSARWVAMTRSIQHRITLYVCPCCISSSVGQNRHPAGGRWQYAVIFARKAGDTSFRLQVRGQHRMYRKWYLTRRPGTNETTMDQSNTPITRSQYGVHWPAPR